MSAPHAVRFPEPHPNPETQPYWEAARTGRLLLQHCEDCDWPFLYPRLVCPHCWGEHLSWIPAAGTGVVETATVVHRAGHPAFQELVPYTCAVVRLTEGPTLMTNVVGDHGGLAAIGCRVRVTFITREGWALPVAELLEPVPATSVGGKP